MSLTSTIFCKKYKKTSVCHQSQNFKDSLSTKNFKFSLFQKSESYSKINIIGCTVRTYVDLHSNLISPEKSLLKKMKKKISIKKHTSTYKE